MLQTSSGFAHETLDRLCTVLDSCVHEEFNDAHKKLMEPAGTGLKDVIDLVGDVLETCIFALHDQGFSQDRAREVALQLQELAQATKTMSQKFVSVEKKQSGSKVNLDMMGENIVANNVCAFARLTSDYVAQLQVEKKVPPSMDQFKAIWDPNVIMHSDHLMWVLRNGCSILVAFWVGYRGYNKTILGSNASIAATVCILLSNFVGSALSNNLNRLQGVVLGTVLGSLIWAFLAWCQWWAYITMTVTLYVWVLVSLFIYYHSAQYSTVGLLIGVFGAKAMIDGCSEVIISPTVAYYQIIDITVAIVIMTVVDMLLSQSRASDLARAKYLQAFRPLREYAELLLGSEPKEFQRAKGSIRATLANAAALGREAALEPRYWRHNFPAATFQQAVACLENLRFSLATIESNVTRGDGTGKRIKADAFLQVSQLQSFKALRDLFLEFLDGTSKKVDDTLKNDFGSDAFLKSRKKKEEDSARNETPRVKRSVRVIQNFVQEVNNSGVLKDSTIETVEDCQIADMCVLVSCLQAAFEKFEEVDACMLAT
jgi:uncharacterized membrane protein YccC